MIRTIEPVEDSKVTTMSAKKPEPTLQFQGTRGFDLFEEEDENGNRMIKIYRGKTLWSIFFGDKASAVNAMYSTYVATLNRVLLEAQERIKDPSRAEGGKVEAEGEGMPLLTKEIETK